MDYLITNLIDELLWQIEDISFYAVMVMGYFATAIAQYAGKYAALRENDKALNPIANAFYAGAMYGVSETWRLGDFSDIYFKQEAERRLHVAHKTKRSVWA